MHGERFLHSSRPSASRYHEYDCAFRAVTQRTVPSAVRKGARHVSSWNLPQCSLRLVPHARDAQWVLTEEPGPEGKGDLGEGTVGYVLVRERVLMHLGSHVARVDTDD